MTAATTSWEDITKRWRELYDRQAELAQGWLDGQAELAGTPAGAARAMAELWRSWLALGEGGLPLRELLAELPDQAVLSVEVPMGSEAPAELRARRIRDATQRLFERCRAGDPRRAGGGEQ